MQEHMHQDMKAELKNGSIESYNGSDIGELCKTIEMRK